MQRPPLCFQYFSRLPFSASKVFQWHLQPGALERMIPPWMNIRILEKGSPSQVGSLTVLELRVLWMRMLWYARHSSFTAGIEFMDKQERGPFCSFQHIHRVTSVDSFCILSDIIEYRAPFFLQESYVQKQLERQFAFRHRRILSDLSVLQKYGRAPQRILVSGASGMVGQSLCAFLAVSGHEVFRLKRQESDLAAHIIGWDPLQKRSYTTEDFEGFDAVIHLAGENIAAKKWSKKQREILVQSRCDDTRLLSQILSNLARPPKVFISASAVGIYGDRQEEYLTEDSTIASDFLGKLCAGWEEASSLLTNRGVRRVQARFGYILDPQGGMLKQMLPVFRMGLGGKIGSGKQIMPWVALDDVVYGIYHCLMESSLSGPINMVAPKPIEQKEFARILAKAVHRSYFFSVPALLLKILLPQRAEALLLRSAHVLPKKLQDSGYEFIYRDLREYFSLNL